MGAGVSLAPDIVFGRHRLRIRPAAGGFVGIVVGDSANRYGGASEAEVLRKLQDAVLRTEKGFVGYDGARARFLQFFPGGFSDPVYVGSGDMNEGAYKRNLSRRAHEELPPESAHAADAAAQAVRLFQQNTLLNWQGSARLVETLRGPDGPALLGAIAAFADGDRAAALRELRRFSQADGVSWATVTFLPFLWRPERHILLKPEFSRAYALAVGHPFAVLYLPELVPEVYDSLLDLSAETRSRIADLAPADMIDIHSFMWTAVNYRGADAEETT